jgi:hypothetical protein
MRHSFYLPCRTPSTPRTLNDCALTGLAPDLLCQATKRALARGLVTKAELAGVDFARRRQLLVFDRFLARVVALFGDAVLLYAPTRNFCGMGRKSICFALSSEHD